MVHFFQHRSIRSKLTTMTMLTATLALFLACAGFAIVDYSTFRAELVKQLMTHAAIVGENSTAALMFDNPSDAAQTLSSLAAEKNIEAACIYTPSGNIFSIYTARGITRGDFPVTPLVNDHRFGAHSLEVFKRIDIDDKQIGTVYVRSNLNALYKRGTHYLVICLSLVLISGLAAFALARRLQRFVADPIQHLAQTAKTISTEKNYSLRATKHSDDELGILIDCFNEMLTQIQTRDSSLQQARLDAERANSAKSDFLAKMSHEIRTPLNGVTGTVQLLLETELSANQRRLAQLARASGDALLTLITDILDFSKIEAGKMELETIEMNPQTIAEEAMDIVGTKAAKKGLELACYADMKVDRTMRGDPDRIRQILTNLINNAIKFTDKGSVVVRARVESETQTHAVLKYLVTDTGPGIPADRMNRLFKSFSQVDASTTRKHGGTGLGLIISKQLAEMMGGSIGIESEEGNGATFWFTIRLEKHAESEQREVPASLKNQRLLVVTPNRVHAEVLREQLANWKFESLAAFTIDAVEETLRAARADGRPISLILCDAQDAAAEAIALARTLRSIPEHVGTKMMLMTAVSQPMNAETLSESGVVGVILKPIHQSQLFDAIASVMGGGACHGMEEKGSGRESLLIESSILKGTRILVAEDNEVNQIVTGEMLAKLGCIFEMVADGQQAHDRAIAGGWDLVLMDCHMPKLDGFEATRRIRELEAAEGRARLPIVALTANAVKGDRELCLNAGMDSYVTKPIHVAKLVNTLEALLKGKSRVTPPTMEAVATPSTEHPFDIMNAFERCMSNAGVVSRVLAKFSEHAPRTMAELHEKIAANDFPETMRLAHGLKGAAANISAEKLRELAFALEQLGHGSDLHGATELLAQMEQELNRCIAFIPEAISQLPSPEQ